MRAEWLKRAEGKLRKELEYGAVLQSSNSEMWTLDTRGDYLVS